ncbi:MAG: Crp/Fnr family transcriptional regulator [Eubacteriaceae bacterium]|jgi:CRP-like cAMP-binding protein|nr:Crp/Fnr family transcriptional regulator [Eubacteriaceae bacterium]
MDEKYAGYIKKLPDTHLFRGLSEKQCAAIFDEVHMRVFRPAAGASIVRQGEIQNVFYYVYSGIVRGEKFHIEGGIHLVENYESNDFIGLDTVGSTTRIAPWTLIAGEEAPVLLEISADDLLSCSFRDDILMNIIQMLANENIKKAYKVNIVSKQSIRDRVLTFLLIRAEKTGKEEFHIRMTQEQLAQFLCVNRSSLSHELSEMRREGLIDFKGDYFKLL